MSGKGLKPPSRPRFKGRPVGKQRTRRFMLSIGAAGVVVLLLMGYLSFNVANRVPGRSYYDVYAEFAEADNLANHYEVRIGGRRAGQVLKPEVRDGRARVRLRLSKEFGPLRSDTRTRVRLRSAVGVRYLEVTPGTRGRVLAQNETIPARNQLESVPLDAVLGTFDPDTREGLKLFVTQFGGGLAGNGNAINSAIRDAGPFFDDLGSRSQTIAARPGAVRNLISGTGRTLEHLDGVRDELAGAFAPAADAARAFANTRAGFGSTLEQAPPALNTLSARLPAVTALVGEVDGLARRGKRTLDLAPGALTRTDRLLVDSQPALKEADDTLDLVRKATPPTVKLLETLRPQLPDVRDLISSVRPTARYIGPRQCDLVNFTTGWANTLKWGDARGAQVNFFLSLGNIAGSGLVGGLRPEALGLEKILGAANSTAYPGPCNGDVSATNGPEGITVEESAMGYRYGYENPPGFGQTGRNR